MPVKYSENIGTSNTYYICDCPHNFLGQSGGVEKFQRQRRGRYGLPKMEALTGRWKNIPCRGSLSHAPQTSLRVSKESLIVFFDRPL